MASVTLISSGFLTTVQDCGRWGWQDRGVSVSGPMDPWSHRVANTLVGNDAHAATLEVTAVGPELQFDDERLVAVTGGDFDIAIDGRAVSMHAPLVAAAGSRLRVGSRRGGARAYLAVAGGFDVPSVLGSRATHLPSGLGGWHGRALRAGDQLPLGSAPRPKAVTRNPNRIVSPRTPSTATLRVVPGPQPSHFGWDALATLQSAPYVVDPSSDRMGFRLRGPALERLPRTEIISDATPLGALQVPPSEQPILLMADRPTSGGYPIVATVITADIGVAGQLGPGDLVRFVSASIGEAHAALIAQERELLSMEQPSDGRR